MASIPPDSSAIHTWSASEWFAFAVPVLLALGGVAAVRLAYFWARRLRWQRREMTEQGARASLAIPADVAKPETYPGVGDIDAEQKAQHYRVIDHQGRYRATALVIAVLPSLALLALALQVILWPEGRSVGVGLVTAEFLLLAALTVLAWGHRDPVRHWVSGRIRSELLRREQYLCLGEVGPYLQAVPASPPATGGSSGRTLEIAQQRLSWIRQLESELPGRALGWESVGGGWGGQASTSWMQELFAAPLPGTPLPDLLQRANTYLHYRIRKQKLWFELAARGNEAGEQRLGIALKVALIAALTAAVIHAVLLLVESVVPSATHALGGFGAAVLALAFVLPPASAAILAMGGLFNSRLLAATYHATHQVLSQMEQRLHRLVAEGTSATTDAERARIQRRFQTLVLEVEQALTQELERWVILTYRREHEFGV